MDKQISDEDDYGVVLADCDTGSEPLNSQGGLWPTLGDRKSGRSGSTYTSRPFSGRHLRLFHWGNAGWVQGVRISEKTGPDLS